MAEYFQIPEVGTKVRPGSYFNVDKNGDDDSFGAIDGVVVAVFKATFGPVDKVTVLERGDDYTTIYGDGLTTDLIREVLYGGAKKVISEIDRLYEQTTQDEAAINSLVSLRILEHVGKAKAKGVDKLDNQALAAKYPVKRDWINQSITYKYKTRLASKEIDRVTQATQMNILIN